MAKGYGFGAEGDWKHAAMVRALKVMGAGLKGGCSFMEDYTYHLNPKGMKVLGAHMLEICPSLGKGKARLEVHPLGIGPPHHAPLLHVGNPGLQHLQGRRGPHELGDGEQARAHTHDP